MLFNGPLSDPNTSVVALNVVGGWGQLKFRATPKLEFNGAYGQDSPFAADIRLFGDASESYAPFFLTGNRAAFGNVIYRPRSDLLLSVEYRRIGRSPFTTTVTRQASSTCPWGSYSKTSA